VSNTIDGYLAELRAQLAGADPALIQDALYDAEEYLRSEVPDPNDEAALAAAVDRYGTPEEVAAAYRETELTVARALRRPEPRADRSLAARFFGIVADPSAYGALFYMFLALVTGVAYFTVAVTGLSLSVGLAILIVGVPIMLLFLAMVRAISFAEGRLVEGFFGERMPRRPRVVAQQGNIPERIKAWITDARTWTTILYMVLQLPLGVFYFSLFTSLLATAAGLVAAPIAQLIWHTPIFIDGDYAYRVAGWFMPIMIAAGLLLFVVTLHAAKLIGKAHAAYAKVMLVGRPDPAPSTTSAAAPAAM
jgi:uncharacterized membrane protein